MFFYLLDRIMPCNPLPSITSLSKVSEHFKTRPLQIWTRKFCGVQQIRERLTANHLFPPNSRYLQDGQIAAWPYRKLFVVSELSFLQMMSHNRVYCVFSPRPKRNAATRDFN